jgi:hypothetical protein
VREPPGTKTPKPETPKSQSPKIFEDKRTVEDLTVGSSWTKTPKPESEYESLVDRDPETRSPKICRAKQSSENLVDSKRFSYSRWFMNVEVLLRV